MQVFKLVQTFSCDIGLGIRQKSCFYHSALNCTKIYSHMKRTKDVD